MNKTYTQKQIDDLVEMSNSDSRLELYEIGSTAAAKEVEGVHFPKSFTN